MLKSVVDMQDELKNDALARDAKRRVKSARHQLEKPVADRKKARGDISELQGEEAFLNQRLRDLQVKNEGLPGEEAYLNRWIGTLQHETHRLQAEEASSSQKIADLQHQTREWAQTATILKQERQSQKGRKKYKDIQMKWLD